MPRTQINQIIVNLIGTATLIIILLDVMALAVFIWGIVKFIFAASNPEKLKDAKQILWWGVIGLFVLVSITGIVLAIQTYFGIGGNLPVPIPQFRPVPAGSSGGYSGGNDGQPTGGGRFPPGGSSGSGTSGGNGGQPSNCNQVVHDYQECLQCYSRESCDNAFPQPPTSNCNQVVHDYQECLQCYSRESCDNAFPQPPT